MADGFFDGTLDDCFDDQGFFELASLTLGLPAPSLPVAHESRPAPTSHPYYLGGRHAVGDTSHSSGGVHVVGEAVIGGAAGSPSDLQVQERRGSLGPAGADLIPGPTQPAFHRPTAVPTRHHDDSRPNTSPLTSPSPRASTRTSTLHRQPDTLLPTHLLRHLSNLSTDTVLRSSPRHKPVPRDNPSVAAQSFEPHHTSSPAAAASYPRRPFVRRATPREDAENRNRRNMSGNSRYKTSLRPGDLTLPAPPSRAGPSSGSASRRSRRSTSRALQPEQAPATQKRKRATSTDSLFGDSFDGQEVVDLVDKDEVPAEILGNSQQETTKYVKLGAFDCVICMDNVTDLTVTHCGHLFCSECLHSALNMDVTKKVCPICRQKLDKVPPSGKFSQKAKGFYPLELKLMTKKTLGKRPAQSSQTSV